MKRRWKNHAIASVLLVGAAIVQASAADAPAPAPADNGVGALGRIEPQSGLVELGGGPASRLLGLTVRVGDVVKNEQLLGYFDDYPVQAAARDQAAAQLAEAQARLKAQTELGQAQIENAEKQRAEPQIRIARATDAATRAAVPVDSLTKALAVAEARVKTATIIAPIDGTILDIGVHPGESIGNRPVLTLGDVSKMRVRAEVYETDIPRVKLGQSVTINSRALVQPLSGHVVEIGRMVFKNSVLSADPAARVDARIVPVRIELDDASALSGLSNLTVDVVIAAAPAAGTAAKAANK